MAETIDVDVDVILKSIAEKWLHLSLDYLLLMQTFLKNDDHLAHRMRFFTQQYLDFLSPDNFLLTNPRQLFTADHV